MSRNLRGIYEDGVFRPLEPVRLAEHQEITLVLETTENVASAAAGLVERMQSDPLLDVVAQTHASFLAGCVLDQSRLDKGYSLTDCISMNVMRRDGLIEVLTNDEHFAQEGFCCPLRD